MNIDQIRSFLEIAATGNFNRAAENLNVTQSTVSARIKALEDQLGQSLFTRNHAGASLTAAGQQFRRYALNMHMLWQQARQQVSLPEGIRAVLGLGAQVSLWQRLIPLWIPWMRERAPEVALRMEADYSASMMRQLADGLLDVGVMYQPRQTPGLQIETLLEEQLVLASTEKRPVTAGWQQDYVFVDWGDDFRARHSAAFPEMETPAISVGLGEVGLQYILRNGGAGYFPLRVVRPLLREKRLFRLPKAPVISRPAYLVYPADAVDDEPLSLALDGLRHIASLESDR